MPDISMCSGGDCPARMTCYRYRAVPSMLWQNWFVEVPWDSYPSQRTKHTDGTMCCGQYDPIKKGDKLREVPDHGKLS